MKTGLQIGTILYAFAIASTAIADDSITLAEIVPAVAGTDLGQIVVAAAPTPGTTRAVRRSEVVAAVRQAGRETRGLVIPANTRIRREVRRVDGDEVISLATSAVRAALAPCTTENIEAPPGTITLGQGAVEVRAEGEAPRQSGRVTTMVVFSQGDRETRVAVRAQVSCPAPVVRSGARVTVRAAVGNVRASVPGEARQTGRVGDVIRVVNSTTNAVLSARVVSSEVVEVIR